MPATSWTEIERRRLAEEERGGTLDDHYARARRTFGMTEDVPYDPSGRIVLPPMMRRKGKIEDLALFVGIGGIVEIWNPRIALEEGDADLARSPPIGSRKRGSRHERPDRVPPRTSRCCSTR